MRLARRGCRVRQSRRARRRRRQRTCRIAWRKCSFPGNRPRPRRGREPRTFMVAFVRDRRGGHAVLLHGGPGPQLGNLRVHCAHGRQHGIRRRAGRRVLGRGRSGAHRVRPARRPRRPASRDGGRGGAAAGRHTGAGRLLQRRRVRGLPYRARRGLLGRHHRLGDRRSRRAAPLPFGRGHRLLRAGPGARHVRGPGAGAVPGEHRPRREPLPGPCRDRGARPGACLLYTSRCV